MRDTKSVGDRSEAMVLAALLVAGKKVLQPFGEGHRYDLVFEDGDSFRRVQCKTGRIRKGVLKFRACSVHYHRGGTSQSYRGQIEFFGVYCPDNEKVYLVPVAQVPENTAYLRVEAPRNGQARGMRWARDFELRTTEPG